MKLTVTQIDTELRKLMTEQPTFIYNTSGKKVVCSYNKESSSDPKPNNGCIFGQALQALGIPKEKLHSNAEIGGLILSALPAPMERPAYWGFIQSDQDNGVVWGKLLLHMPDAPKTHEDAISEPLQQTGATTSQLTETLLEANTCY